MTENLSRVEAVPVEPRSASKPGSCTPGSGRTRTRAHARCQSPDHQLRVRGPNRRRPLNLQEYGNTYPHHEPDHRGVRATMANLEGGAGAVAFASGLAAQNAALFTLLEPGDHVVSSSALYGGTVNQFKHVLRKMNVRADLGRPRRSSPLGEGGPGRTRRRSSARRSATRAERAGHRGGGGRRALPRAAADRGQHVRLAVPVPPDRVGRRHRDPLGDQVHWRPRHLDRRGRGRVRPVRLVQRRFPVVADPSPPTTACSSRDLRDVRLPDEAPGRPCATSARRCRPSTPSCSCRVWRRCRCGWRSRRQRAAVAAFLDPARAGVERDLPACRGAMPPLVEKYLPLGAAPSSPSIARRPTGGQDLIRGMTLWSHLANVGDAKA